MRLSRQMKKPYMKIITVSYRLPLSIKKQGRKTTITQSAGGLATAIRSYSDKSNANLTWVGVADFEKNMWESHKDSFQKNFDVEPVYLDKKINKGFYNIFSNSVLWALFHYFPSYMEYNDEAFEAYKTANEVVAEKINSLYEPGDTIWIHDYHFLGLAKLIRDQHPDAKIGFFLHIPFPNFELFRILPNKVKRYLLEGMLGSNLVGFHTWDNAIHFTECVEKILGLSQRSFVFSQDTHRTKVGSFPISIDFDKFHDSYDKPNVATLRNEIRDQYPDKKIIFSVDRLDYTKGINNRLNAFESFLEKHPEWKEKVVFLLVIVPSREEISKYGERKRMIELNISRINGTLGNYKWTPVVYQYQSVDFDKLIALYTSADVALISPVRDGMNLVAKEFVASRKDLRGTLILSIMAGAAKELQEAININPLDTELIGEKIAQALTMDETEQERRLKRMQTYLKVHDVFKWASDFLGATGEMHSQDSKATHLQGHEVEIVEKFRQGNKRLLLLDFDGTLVNLERRPELAVPTEYLINLLANLAADPKNEVWIISGRDRNFLQKWLGHLRIGLVAEHGGYIKRDNWEPVIHGTQEWKQRVINIMNEYVATNAESFIEEKEFGVAWHYRNVDERQGFLTSRELLTLLKNHLYNTPTQIIDGNKVIEAKHFMAHKGTTCRDNILCNGDYDFTIAFGDDKTDEDLFEQLTGENEFSVKVGPGNTAAKYRVKSVEEVLAFLSQLENHSVVQ